MFMFSVCRRDSESLRTTSKTSTSQPKLILEPCWKRPSSSRIGWLIIVFMINRLTNCVYCSLIVSSSHLSFHHQVKKTHTGIGPASERRREDPSEWQTIPRPGVRPRGAQEAHHVLHWRSGPAWAATTSNRLRAHPSLDQVTNSTIFSGGARLLLALPGQSMTWPENPQDSTLQARRCWPCSVIAGGHVASPMYHRDIRLRSLCYVATHPWLSLRRRANTGNVNLRVTLDPSPLWLTTSEERGSDAVAALAAIIV